VIPYVKRTREVAGTVAKREVVAQALNMAVSGGGFAFIASAMKNYGLADTGGGEIRLTELGRRVAYEKDQKLLEEAKAEAVSHVDLFRDYYAQHGTDVTEDKVGVFLRAKAQADVEEISKNTGGIIKLLKSNLHYMSGVHVEGTSSGQTFEGRQADEPTRSAGRQEGGDSRNVIPINDNLIEFRMGTYLMRFPMDDPQTAKTVIDTLLDNKSKSTSTTSNNAPVEAGNG